MLGRLEQTAIGKAVAHGEIGDVCAWKTKKLGAYAIQLEWSNAASKCV